MPKRQEAVGETSPRRRILRAFAERARQTGIRGVVLAELAADLGMSKKTLYQHFESKEDLVRALVEEWAERVRSGAGVAATRGLGPHDLVRAWAESWTAGIGRFSADFWRELERDHPAAWSVFRQTREEGRRRARERMGKELRPEVRPEVAGELFQIAVAHFNDPQLCERLGLTRKEAVLAALEIWMNGALAPPDAPGRKRGA